MQDILFLFLLQGFFTQDFKKNPLIGMAAAFAGVSAGFSANLFPSTPSDVIIGKNAQLFAESQGVPFANAAGKVLNGPTMHYFFIAASTILLTLVGAFVTVKFIKPRLEKQSYTIFR